MCLIKPIKETQVNKVVSLIAQQLGQLLTPSKNGPMGATIKS